MAWLRGPTRGVSHLNTNLLVHELIKEVDDCLGDPWGKFFDRWAIQNGAKGLNGCVLEDPRVAVRVS